MGFSQLKRWTIMLFLSFCFISTHLAAKAHIYMTPDMQQVSLGQIFDVVVNIQDVQSSPADSTLRGASVKIYFDPAILHVVSQTEGSFLRSFGSTLPFPFHNNTEGWAQFDNSILGGGTMASGSGNLYSVRFEVVGNGTSDLTFANIQLRNPENYPVGFTSQNGVIYSGDAMLSFEPVTSNILIGEECTVYVHVENVVGLKGARSSVLFNSAIVQVVSITAGPFLKGAGNTTTVFTQINPAQVICDESILQPQNYGETGEGYLAEIVFRGVAEGSSTLSFDLTDTRLRDPENQPLDYTAGTGIINVGPPIAVELTDYSATISDGDVELCWSTESESDAAGFNVYRSLQKDDGFEKINTSLITAAGTVCSGADYSFKDYAVPEGMLYYQLEQVDLNGSSTWYEPIRVDNTTSSINSQSDYPSELILAGNYPNPFNPSTTISYSIPTQAPVMLFISDAQGHIVKTLINDIQSAGWHSVLWNGRNDNDNPVASGIYFYAVHAGDFTARGKMLLVK